MDGTGELFSPLLHGLSEFDCVVISLPQSGPQDYESLTHYVRARLPEDDFILVAESFSGAIGMQLVQQKIENIKGIIFVASFLSSPSRRLIALAKILPLKFMASLPFSKSFYKLLFLGLSASDELTRLFQSIVLAIPADIIRARLNTIQSLTFDFKSSELPAGYIQATFDRLVPSDKAIEVSRLFKNIIIKPIVGPHFILQAHPNECVLAITELAHVINNQKPKDS